MEKMKGAYRWFLTTSMLVGMPVVLLLVLLGIQKFAFTTTCYVANYRCEYAIGANGGMADYMGELLAANPDVDIKAEKRRH